MRPKPLILAIETSGRIGSVAIALGEQILSETQFSGPMRHSAEIFPAVHDLLERFGRKPKEIEHIYISAGPGSFTGLRIAVTLAKTMNLANAAKIIAVDTLDVIAANATDYISDFACATPDKKEEKVKGLTRIATILDAKRSQFFVAVYQNKEGRWEKSTPDCLMTAGEFVENCGGNSRPVWLLGEGLVYHKDKFKADGIRFLDERYWKARAEKVYNLGWEKALAGQFADPLTLQPTYLRGADVKEKSGLSF
ncbi:MAG: tRNA (adenosine(37)-N6)-threonylcarbamoyltransferase complex dimerization subunit type 1 TsaB [Sedimentisphaerales bacterium]